MPETHMEELADTECRKLLAERYLGRLASRTSAGR
jgi:hypothetical protein